MATWYLPFLSVLFNLANASCGALQGLNRASRTTERDTVRQWPPRDFKIFRTTLSCIHAYWSQTAKGLDQRPATSHQSKPNGSLRNQHPLTKIPHKIPRHSAQAPTRSPQLQPRTPSRRHPHADIHTDTQTHMDKHGTATPTPRSSPRRLRRARQDARAPAGTLRAPLHWCACLSA